MSDDDQTLGLDAPEGGGNEDDLRQRLAAAEAEAKNAANYADKLSDRLATLEAIIPKMEQAGRATLSRGTENRNFIDDIYRRLRRAVAALVGSSAGDTIIWQLQKDGGSGGAIGVRPTWTYTLIDKNTGATVASHIPLSGGIGRFVNMPNTEASWGLGYINASGTPVLIAAGESYDWFLCGS